MIYKHIHSNAHIIHLRTLTLLYTCKIANKIIRYLYNYICPLLTL